MNTNIALLSGLSFWLMALGSMAHAETRPLRIWHGLSAEDTKWLAEGIQQFTDATGIRVQIHEQVDVEVALYSQDEAENVPDVVMVVSNLTGLARQFGFSSVPAAELASIRTDLRRGVEQQGMAYGIPLFLSDTLLFYRNTKLAPNVPSSIDALLAKKDSGSAICWALNRPFYFTPILEAEETPGKAFATGRKIVTASGAKRDCDPRCAMTRFYNGECAYWVGVSSSRQDARAHLGGDLAISILPPLHEHGARLKPFIGTFAMAFPNDSLNGPRRSDLLKLGRFLLSAARQERLMPVSARLPVRDATLKVVEKTTSGDEAIQLEQLRQAKPMPNSLATAAMWPALRKVLNAELDQPLGNGEATYKALLQDYTERLSALKGRQ